MREFELHERIDVTKTFLPEISEFTSILQEAWETRWLTNGGKLIMQLVEELKEYLDTPHILVTTNGTLALQLAIKALKLKGEVITTPFSYIATSSSLIWEDCQPVYVDIESDTWCIDARKIENAITSETTGILATHVFGNPCDVEKIENIAKRNNLKVIYDAAHAFDVKYKDASIFNYGDISICSFHATKIFHTGEGGCLVTQCKELSDSLLHLHNFGHKGEEDFHGLGINGKASELQAALGLSILPYIPGIIESRKKIVEKYNNILTDTRLKTISIREETRWNYSYYPVVFESEEDLMNVKEALNKANIYPRRYFYPSLNKVSYISGKDMPIAEDVAGKILCLPLYQDLSIKDVRFICSIIKSQLV